MVTWHRRRTPNPNNLPPACYEPAPTAEALRSCIPRRLVCLCVTQHIVVRLDCVVEQRNQLGDIRRWRVFDAQLIERLHALPAHLQIATLQQWPCTHGTAHML